METLDRQASASGTHANPPLRPIAGRADGQIARPGTEPAVRIEGLGKDYVHPWTLKRTVGLAGLDRTVEPGEVFGYLGPNGAGKTTTLKILTGLLKPTRGRAWLFGVPVDDVRSRRPLGFLPEQPYFYDYLTGPEYVEMTARLSGLGGAEASRASREWLGRVGLGGRERLVLRKYSKGMLQRLGLAAALVHGPELLVLDEPMSGLDPFGRRDVRDLILEQRERGTTVLFSSHILPDVEMLCDRVAIVLRGKLERVATVGELVGQRGSVELRCARLGACEVPGALQGALVRSDRADETTFTLAEPARLQESLAWLVSQRIEVRSVTPQRTSLEELFMAAADNAGEAARRIA